MNIKIIGLILLLIALSIRDLKHKTIQNWVFLVLGALGILFSLWNKTALFPLICGLIPGLTLLLVSYISKEQIGYGDGILICELSLFISMEQMVVLLMGAFFVSFVVSVILIGLKKATKKTQIAFCPCLLAGMLLSLWIV